MFCVGCEYLFRYFEQQGDNNPLSDKLLTQNRIILLLLFGAHRFGTIKLFSVSNMVSNDLSVTFTTTKVLKYSRKGKPLEKFEYIIDRLEIMQIKFEHRPAHYYGQEAI